MIGYKNYDDEDDLVDLPDYDHYRNIDTTEEDLERDHGVDILNINISIFKLNISININWF